MADLNDVVREWLVGGGIGGAPDTPAAADIPNGATAIAERFLLSLAGDPIPGSQSLAVGAAAKGLTVPSVALSAVCFVEGVSIRLALDGSIPTAAVGALVAAGTIFRLTGRATMQQAQMIGTAGGAVVGVVYFD